MQGLCSNRSDPYCSAAQVEVTMSRQLYHSAITGIKNPSSRFRAVSLEYITLMRLDRMHNHLRRGARQGLSSHAIGSWVAIKTRYFGPQNSDKRSSSHGTRGGAC